MAQPLGYKRGELGEAFGNYLEPSQRLDNRNEQLKDYKKAQLQKSFNEYIPLAEKQERIDDFVNQLEMQGITDYCSDYDGTITKLHTFYHFETSNKFFNPGAKDSELRANLKIGAKKQETKEYLQNVIADFDEFKMLAQALEDRGINFHIISLSGKKAIEDTLELLEIDENINVYGVGEVSQYGGKRGVMRSILDNNPNGKVFFVDDAKKEHERLELLRNDNNYSNRLVTFKCEETNEIGVAKGFTGNAIEAATLGLRKNQQVIIDSPVPSKRKVTFASTPLMPKQQNTVNTNINNNKSDNRVWRNFASMPRANEVATNDVNNKENNNPSNLHRQNAFKDRTKGYNQNISQTSTKTYRNDQSYSLLEVDEKKFLNTLYNYCHKQTSKKELEQSFQNLQKNPAYTMNSKWGMDFVEHKFRKNMVEADPSLDSIKSIITKSTSQRTALKALAVLDNVDGSRGLHNITKDIKDEVAVNNIGNPTILGKWTARILGGIKSLVSNDKSH